MLTQVDPKTITLVNNYSRYSDVADRTQQVLDRAVSMIENGQTSPVRLNQVGGELIPITGTTRVAAALLIRSGFKAGEKDYAPDPDFTLSAEIVGVSEQEAAVQGAVDNLERDNLTAIDIGNLAQKWGKEFKWSYKQITEKLHISDPNKVSQCARLMTFSKEIKDAIHSGLVSASAALEVFKFKGNQQTAARKALADAVKAGKSITASQIKKAAEAAPEEKSDAGDGEGSESGGGDGSEKKVTKKKDAARKGSEIRESIQGWVDHISKLTEESRATLPVAYVSLVKDLLRYVKGEIKDTTYMQKFDAAFDVSPKVWDDVVGAE